VAVRSQSNPFSSSQRRAGGLGGTSASRPVPPVPVDEPWLLDSREVARLLGIGRTKAFQMMASAELPTVRIGRCVRVSREALLHWVSRQVPEDIAAEPISWLREEPSKLRTASR
jgi:excisionase family DNA binding protein